MLEESEGEVDPVIQAIGALRAEFDALIGEELERLRPGRPALAPRSVEGPDDGGDHTCASPPTGPNPRDFRPRPWPPEGDGDDGEDSGDAARRLDALAQRLEGRLRRSRDRDAQRPRPDDQSGDGSARPPEGGNDA